MADVEQVEAAVGEDHPFTGGLPGLDLDLGIRPVEDLGGLFQGGLAADGGQQLIPGNRDGTHLAHHHPGGQVGEVGGVVPGQPGGEASGEGGDDGIPGTGDIEDLLRHSRDAADAGIIQQGQTKLAQGQDQQAQDQIAAELGRGGQEAVQVRPRLARGQGEFGPIGGDEAGTGVFAEVLALGVHQDRNAPGLSRWDEALAKGGGEDAFVIVGEHQGCGAGQQGFNGRPKAGLVQWGEGLCRFLVNAQHLLMIADDPGLDRGGPIPGRDHRLGLDAVRGQGGEQGGPVRVAAGEPRELDPQPQVGQVTGDIGRAAGALGAAPQPHHRHRGFGGDALDLPPEIAIKHQIADHQDPPGAETRADRPQDGLGMREQDPSSGRRRAGRERGPSSGRGRRCGGASGGAGIGDLPWGGGGERS